jgi:hypothetical protein
MNKNTENYLNLQNPFVCNSKFQVRLSPNKDPRYNKITGKEHIFEGENSSNGNKYLINPCDEKMSYVFGKGEEKEMTDFDKFDYQVPIEKLNENKDKDLHKEALPLSFLQIKTEIEGVEWYKKHYPKIPDDLLPIIARYHWGDPITKKSIKNEGKKIKKKLEKKGFEINNNKDYYTIELN